MQHISSKFCKSLIHRINMVMFLELLHSVEDAN